MKFPFYFPIIFLVAILCLGIVCWIPFHWNVEAEIRQEQLIREIPIRRVDWNKRIQKISIVTTYEIGGPR